MPALDAVLAEPDLQRAGRIVLTGDIAAGPQPTEVLDRLLGLGDKVVWVRGNADRELVELARGEVDDVGDPIARRRRASSRPSWRSYLAVARIRSQARPPRTARAVPDPRSRSPAETWRS